MAEFAAVGRPLERSSKSWFAALAFLGGAVLSLAGCAGRSEKLEQSSRTSSGAAAGLSATGGAGGTTVGSGGTKASGTGGSGGAAGGTGGATAGSGGATARGGTGGTGAAAHGGGGIGASAGSGASAQGGDLSQGGEGGATVRDCLLAIRLDQCCAQPEPITEAEFDADPCWWLWDPVGGATHRDGCLATDCDASCPRVVLPSRTVERDASGQCQFASECSTVDDCLLLWDSRTGCACDVQPLPRAYEGLGCWVPPTSAPPPGCGDGAKPCDCTVMPPLSCVPTPSNGGRCVAEYLPHPEQGLLGRDDRCVAEKQCPAELSGIECPICVVPGDAACGGPPPPDATCETDAECSAAATNMICDALPCQNKKCVQGCIADSDCAPSEVCGADHRCAPAPCTVDSDCHANRRCDDGHCVRRSCTLSSECCTAMSCGGYCVNNLCFEVPGTCQDGCAP